MPLSFIIPELTPNFIPLFLLSHILTPSRYATLLPKVFTAQFTLSLPFIHTFVFVGACL